MLITRTWSEILTARPEVLGLGLTIGYVMADGHCVYRIFHKQPL